jgi:hypothetical protein
LLGRAATIALHATSGIESCRGRVRGDEHPGATACAGEAARRRSFLSRPRESPPVRAVRTGFGQWLGGEGCGSSALRRLIREIRERPVARQTAAPPRSRRFDQSSVSAHDRRGFQRDGRDPTSAQVEPASSRRRIEHG